MADELFQLLKKVHVDVLILTRKVDEAKEEMIEKSTNVYLERRLYISKKWHLDALKKLRELMPICKASYTLVTRRSDEANDIQMDAFVAGLAKEGRISDEPIRAVDEENQACFQKYLEAFDRWLDAEQTLRNAVAEFGKIKTQFEEATMFSAVPISEEEDLKFLCDLRPANTWRVRIQLKDNVGRDIWHLKNIADEFGFKDFEEGEKEISGPQCCSNPPTLNPSGGSDHVESLGGLDSRVNGSPDS